MVVLLNLLDRTVADVFVHCSISGLLLYYIQFVCGIRSRCVMVVMVMMVPMTDIS